MTKVEAITAVPAPASIPLMTELMRLEILEALHIADDGGARARLGRGLVTLPAHLMARVLAALDDDVRVHGLADAARRALARFRATVSVSGAEQIPARGGIVFVSNHPGLYDALALFSTSGPGRALRIIAAERPVLRAMTGMSQNLLYVREGTFGRGRALLAGLRHVEAGESLLHFPAGRIEPDPAYLEDGTAPLCEWSASIGTLLLEAVRRRGKAMHAVPLWVVPTVIAGVHSVALRKSRVGRRVGALGGGQVGPLLQLVVPGLTHARVEVHFGEATAAEEWVTGASGDDSALRAREVTARLRERVLELTRGVTRRPTG